MFGTGDNRLLGPRSGVHVPSFFLGVPGQVNMDYVPLGTPDILLVVKFRHFYFLPYERDREVMKRSRSRWRCLVVEIPSWRVELYCPLLVSRCLSWIWLIGASAFFFRNF